jgi:hypothetical protein
MPDVIAVLVLVLPVVVVVVQRLWWYLYSLLLAFHYRSYHLCH